MLWHLLIHILIFLPTPYERSTAPINIPFPSSVGAITLTVNNPLTPQDFDIWEAVGDDFSFSIFRVPEVCYLSPFLFADSGAVPMSLVTIFGYSLTNT